MASLHKEYTKFNFDKEHNSGIKLSSTKKDGLIKSRNSIRDKIKKYFKEEKENELQPTFKPQGSFEMNTTVNPIPEYDEEGNKLLKYDLDYGVYFVEKEDEDNKKSIDTWHNWVFNAVDDHTNTPTKDKATCVRVNFADGHHIDLPIYYQIEDDINLAHKSKDWLESNPVEFSNWFNDEAKKDQQLRRIVRYLKAWKNYRETKNTNLKFPSGFALTILATNNFKPDDRNDIAFKNTIDKINTELNKKFECKRPTTPKDEDIFEDFSETRKNDFLKALDSLLTDCKKADSEKNFKKASEYLRKHFGDRFPEGADTDEESAKNKYKTLIGTPLASKPYYAK